MLITTDKAPAEELSVLKPCRLLLLPAELRLAIFELALHYSKRPVSIDFSAETVNPLTSDGMASGAALHMFESATPYDGYWSIEAQPISSRTKAKDTAFALTQTYKQVCVECGDLVYRPEQCRILRPRGLSTISHHEKPEPNPRQS